MTVIGYKKQAHARPTIRRGESSYLQARSWMQDATVSASTEITLNAATTFIQVYAIAKDVYLKWGTDNVTAANFDEVIPAGQYLYFVVPNGQTAVNLIEREAGATIIVIEK